MRQLPSKLLLALGMLLPLFYGCGNDDDGPDLIPPTINKPDDIEVKVGATATISYSVTTNGGYASAAAVSSNTDAATVEVTSKPADGSADGTVVVTVAGKAAGQTTVTLTVTDNQNQNANDEVGVTVKVADTPEPPDTEPTFLAPGDTIAKIPDLSTLAAALDTAGLVEALNDSEKKYTIFAPNNAAFTKLLATQGAADLNALVDLLTTQGLAGVLGAHVVADSLPADLLEEKEYPTLTEGKTITVTKTADNVFVNGAGVVQANIFTSNGVIHIIDSVINVPVPPAQSGATVADTIASREDLSSLNAALEAASLVDTLRTEGPFTVFAPNNAAFEALLNGRTLQQLIDDVGGVEALSSILQAHVVAAELPADQLLDQRVYNSLDGATLTITIRGDQTFVNDAAIVETNLGTGNGIVHIIDKVVNLSAPNTGANGFTVTIENVSSEKRFFQHGTFTIPQGATEAGPAPAERGVYQFQFYAGPKITKDGVSPRLSFVSMLAASNDVFLATSQNGIELYPGGIAVTGDITNQVFLWDAGTRNNTTGEAEPGVVLPYQGEEFLPADQLVSVSISNEGPLFTVQITNNSGATATPTALSPGVYGVHTLNTPLFEQGVAIGLDGLALLAETGDPTVLSATMDRLEGFAVPLSPGVFAIHSADAFPVLTEGTADRGQGLEALAEDGDPTALGTYLGSLVGNGQVKASGVFDIPMEGTTPRAIGPGEHYQFTIGGDVVAPGDYLTIVTMMVQSNDIVYSTPDEGIALFDANGNAFNGDASQRMLAFDIGTETNEYPGAGLNQPIRQAGVPDTRSAEGGVVKVVVADDNTPSADGFIYRPVAQRIKVTITPNP